MKSLSLMHEELQHLRVTAKRLERYALRVRENIWLGDRASLIRALSDTAEAAEITRRLWLAIQQETSARSGDASGALPTSAA
jgi:hypothetical protein